MIPAALGILWLSSPSAVFLVGSVIAIMSLALCNLIPGDPSPGNETLMVNRKQTTPM